jgi:hypothetical protein
MTTRTAPKFWALEFEGLDILDEAGLDGFLEANAECMSKEERCTILHLEPGVTYSDGGGAVVEWSIRRMTDSEVREGGF